MANPNPSANPSESTPQDISENTPSSTTSNNDSVLAGLCYLGLMVIAIPTIIILLMKKDESPFIKFHAIQAIGFTVLNVVINIGFSILSQIPVLGFMAAIGGGLISLGVFLYWIYLVVMAFMGKDPRIPLLADFVNDNFMK